MAYWNLLRRHRTGESVEYGEISTHDELVSLLDRESHRILGLSATEFIDRRAKGMLPERMGVRTLSMLADLESIS
ncbi:MAG: hypothetical protein ACYDEB_11585 [Dehalococcoidia bacterium]